jgi:rubrerythrin
MTADHRRPPDDDAPPEPRGEPVCLLHLVCPECGRLADDGRTGRCPACGTELPEH